MSKLTSINPPKTRTGLPCSVCAALSSLDDESRADYEAWERGEKPELGSDGDMWQRLQALGYRVGKQTIGRHRRRVCRGDE